MGFGNKSRQNETLSDALRERIKQRQKEWTEEESACSVNSDCPPGHLCVNGRCEKLSTTS